MNEPLPENPTREQLIDKHFELTIEAGNLAREVAEIQHTIFHLNEALNDIEEQIDAMTDPEEDGTPSPSSGTTN